MITEQELETLVKEAFPDADVAIFDKTGMRDHYRLWVSSRAFAGKNLIQQHQMVYRALDVPMQDGRLHAVEIKTDVPQA